MTMTMKSTSDFTVIRADDTSVSLRCRRYHEFFWLHADGPEWICPHCTGKKYEVRAREAAEEVFCVPFTRAAPSEFVNSDIRRRLRFHKGKSAALCEDGFVVYYLPRREPRAGYARTILRLGASRLRAEN